MPSFRFSPFSFLCSALTFTFCLSRIHGYVLICTCPVSPGSGVWRLTVPAFVPWTKAQKNVLLATDFDLCPFYIQAKLLDEAIPSIQQWWKEPSSHSFAVLLYKLASRRTLHSISSPIFISWDNEGKWSLTLSIWCCSRGFNARYQNALCCISTRKQFHNASRPIW